MRNQYRNEHIDRIITHAEKTYRLGDWQYIFEDCTPYEAFKVWGELSRHQWGEDKGKIYGIAVPNKREIIFFWQGVEWGVRYWFLAHEIGHAVHVARFPDSIHWPHDKQEDYADEIALEILYAIGLWQLALRIRRPKGH